MVLKPYEVTSMSDLKRKKRNWDLPLSPLPSHVPSVPIFHSTYKVRIFSALTIYFATLLLSFCYLPLFIFRWPLDFICP